jgi:hypothetical protein
MVDAPFNLSAPLVDVPCIIALHMCLAGKLEHALLCAVEAALLVLLFADQSDHVVAAVHACSVDCSIAVCCVASLSKTSLPILLVVFLLLLP